jgi:hypothetical protein
MKPEKWQELADGYGLLEPDERVIAGVGGCSKGYAPLLFGAIGMAFLPSFAIATDRHLIVTQGRHADVVGMFYVDAAEVRLKGGRLLVGDAPPVWVTIIPTQRMEARRLIAAVEQRRAGHAAPAG